MSIDATTTTTTANTMRDALQNALAFKAENPDEKASTAARIYREKESTVRKALQRQRDRKGALVQHGGHTKILSDTQLEAILKYIEDMYLAGIGATKEMIFQAIIHLRASQNPPKKPPSKRWFQTFLKEHPDLIRTVKTKPIAIVRISAQDVDTVESWFTNWALFCKEKGIQASDILNFDETGFRVGVTSGEEIVVPFYVKEVR
jgi:hypothetical protein